MQVEILAFGAHPDDVELGCCGTLLAESSRGKRFGLVDLTEGELGTRGTAASRREEAELAASLMGASFRENLGLRDGFFEGDIGGIKMVPMKKKIRGYRAAITKKNTKTKWEGKKIPYVLSNEVLPENLMVSFVRLYFGWVDTNTIWLVLFSSLSFLSQYEGN